MIYTRKYAAPVGEILLAAGENGLLGLWIQGQKYSLDGGEVEENENDPILAQTADWLNRYFRQERPSIAELKLNPQGSPFAREVWEILCTIPYGATMTYGEIAGILARRRGLSRMSAQAVGGAVGRNPISIIIPCHRVVGAKGNLTGYAGGMEKKVFLLTHEGVNMGKFFVPKKGAAL